MHPILNVEIKQVLCLAQNFAAATYCRDYKLLLGDCRSVIIIVERQNKVPPHHGRLVSPLDTKLGPQHVRTCPPHFMYIITIIVIIINMIMIIIVIILLQLQLQLQLHLRLHLHLLLLLNNDKNNNCNNRNSRSHNNNLYRL